MLLSEIARKLGLSYTGQEKDITGVNTLRDASETEISFLANPKYAEDLAVTKAAAVIIAAAHPGLNCLVSENPYLDFVRCVQFFAKEQGSFSGISPLAWIHPQATIDPGATVYPFACIDAGTVIESGVRIFSNVHIGENCHVGQETIIYPNCSLMADTIVGKRVIIHPGTVLGSDGFGFAQAAEGLTKFPQVGRTVIEDDVEIGANTTIDRAALGETRIGQGTKIDNLVQLGHNVRVGRNCILVAQVGIAGSTVLGDRVILAGQAGLAGHLHLGDGCRIGPKSGVGQDIPSGQDMSGIPAMPHSTFLRASSILPKLPEMRRRLGKLEKELAALRQQIANQEKS